MRKLSGYLVALRGAEQAAARVAAGISQQFLCKEDRAERIHAPIGDESIAGGIAIGKTAINDTADSSRTGSPITIIYAHESFTGDAGEETAGATPTLCVLD
jgi:hypothetical protein